MPRKKKITWVLVGDGAKAQLYSIKTVEPMRLAPVPSGGFRGTKAKNIGPDGALRHALPPSHGVHQREEDKFVTRVSAAVNKAAAEKKFDDLIIVAPARALGIYRKQLDEASHKKIKREIRGEWTKLGSLEVEKHLAKHFMD